MSYERWKWDKTEGDLLVPASRIIPAKASMLVNSFRFSASLGSPSVAASISSTNSMTLPTHASGNYIFMFAYRDGFNTAPTVPGGWAALTATGLVGSNTNSAVLAYKIAASSGETSGTWTNATGLVCQVISGGSIGLGNNPAMRYGTATGNVVVYPGFTLSNTNGRSVILCFGGQRDTTGSFGVSVSGLTQAASGAGSACIVGGHYTTSGVASFSDTNVNIGGSGTSGYACATVEVTNAV
jgi:hypothetical protein